MLTHQKFYFGLKISTNVGNVRFKSQWTFTFIEFISNYYYLIIKKCLVKNKALFDVDAVMW